MVTRFTVTTNGCLKNGGNDTMEWIDATKEKPDVAWGTSLWLKIRWNEKRIGITKATGFYCPESKLYFTPRGRYNPKYVQWLKEV